MLIDAAGLGHKDAKVLVERTKHCVAEQKTCDGAEAIEIWTCDGRQIRMAPLSNFACDQAQRNQKSLQE